jgi:riboflavin kinase / FMN adenylyltransferase
MQDPIHSSISPAPLILAMGQFDGVHRGHQSVFQSAVQAASSCQGIPGCLTFSPHVAELLNPEHAPLLLATPEQNRRWILDCGIQQIHTLPFTHELAAMGPEAFLTLLKLEFPRLVEVVVGENFTFGKDRAGNRDTLPDMAAALGIRAQIVPHIEWEGHTISSTRIRAAVKAGELPQTAALLGREFSLHGTVVKGRGVGRTIGFPTANIQPDLPIRPAPGVYAARLHLEDGLYPGAAFVPDPADPSQTHFGSVIEIHVPGFDRDLYYQDVEISFTERLRGHMPFPTPKAASAQIALDTEKAMKANERVHA